MSHRKYLSGGSTRKMVSIFEKCNVCQTKAATIKCEDCEGKLYCYDCEKELFHSEKHSRQIISHSKVLEFHSKSQKKLRFFEDVIVNTKESSFIQSDCSGQKTHSILNQRSISDLQDQSQQKTTQEDLSPQFKYKFKKENQNEAIYSNRKKSIKIEEDFQLNGEINQKKSTRSDLTQENQFQQQNQQIQQFQQFQQLQQPQQQDNQQQKEFGGENLREKKKYMTLIEHQKQVEENYAYNLQKMRNDLMVVQRELNLERGQKRQEINQLKNEYEEEIRKLKKQRDEYQIKNEILEDKIKSVTDKYENKSKILQQMIEKTTQQLDVIRETKQDEIDEIIEIQKNLIIKEYQTKENQMLGQQNTQVIELQNILQENKSKINFLSQENEKLKNENQIFLLERDQKNKNQEIVNFKYFEIQEKYDNLLQEKNRIQELAEKLISEKENILSKQNEKYQTYSRLQNLVYGRNPTNTKTISKQNQITEDKKKIVFRP